MEKGSKQSHTGDTNSITIEDNGNLAKFVVWQSSQRGQLLSGLTINGERPVLFVATELLVDSKHTDLIGELVRKYQARVVDPKPIPPRADGVVRSKWESAEGKIVLSALRFDTVPMVENSSAIVKEYISKHHYSGCNISVDSPMTAALLSLLAKYNIDQSYLGLNLVGTLASLPFTTITENHVSGINPLDFIGFVGKSRIAQAWQLVESYRQIQHLPAKSVLIAILDSGFWLDPNGKAYVGYGQTASDFGIRPLQLNLLDESVSAGGASGIPNGDGYEAPWHGTHTASAAAAIVGNGAGFAGSGGTVAEPVLFKTDLSVSQIIRCLHVCIAWGVDVLSMSFSIYHGAFGILFSFSAWEDAFQWANDNGLLMLAAAGNDNEELPNYVIRPATRTPGVITVGALTIDNQTNDYTKIASTSNYGSSIGVLAPGTGIPVAPNDVKRQGDVVSGTSMAAPLVAGVAAMMRFVDPTLTGDRLRDILASTGFRGDNVGPCLDAYKAVLSCMNGSLPPDNEPNNSAATAKPLLPIANGALAPSPTGYSGLATQGDQDWWLFQLKDFSNVIIRAEWYQRLSNFSIELVPNDAGSRAMDDMVYDHNIDTGTLVLQGMLAPGTYRIKVTGSGITAYRLGVTIQQAELDADIFELNENFETASWLLFGNEMLNPRQLLRVWGPGYFNATLHAVPNFPGKPLLISDDYYRLEPPASLDIFYLPCVTIAQSDFPIDVILYDENRMVVKKWLQVRNADVFPDVGKRNYLQITGQRPTRYTIHVRRKINSAHLPGPHQKVDLTGLPGWWRNGRLLLKDKVTHFYLDQTNLSSADKQILIAPTSEFLHLELLDMGGTILREGELTKQGGISVSTDGVEKGNYVLRVTRQNKSDLPDSPLPVITMRLLSP